MKELINEFFDEGIHKKRTELCKLFALRRSDKSTWHNYSAFYHYIFNKLGYSSRPFRLFEMGLGTNNTSIVSNMGRFANPGASLQAFSEFYPDAEFFGADIDRDIIFQSDRIKTFWCDQTSTEAVKNMWDQIEGQFDVIIDDGLHEPHANIHFLEHSFQKLADGGIYIIEDILNDDIPKVAEYLNGKFEDAYKTIIMLPMDASWTENSESFRGRVNNVDNNLAIVYKYPKSS